MIAGPGEKLCDRKRRHQVLASPSREQRIVGEGESAPECACLSWPRVAWPWLSAHPSCGLASSPCAANQNLPLITAACRIGSQDGDFSPSPPRASLSYVPYASAQKHLHRRSVRLLSRRSGVGPSGWYATCSSRSDAGSGLFPKGTAMAKKSSTRQSATKRVAKKSSPGKAASSRKTSTQGASKKSHKKTSSSAGMMTRAGKVVAAVALGAAAGAAMGGIKGAITAGEKAAGLPPNGEAGDDAMSGQDKQRSRTAPRRPRAAKGR